MTDADLIAAIEKKSIDDLTLGEIEALRTRLDVSTDVRAALLRRLALEAPLAAALDKHGIDVRGLIAGAAPSNLKARRSTTVRMVATVVLIALSAGAIVFAIARSRQSGEVRPQAKSTIKSTRFAPSKAKVEPAGATAPSESIGAGSPPAPFVPSAEPPPPSAPAEARPDEPWSAAMLRAAPFPAFAEVGFRGYDAQSASPNAALLGRWFAPVGGEPFRIFEARTRFGPCAGVEGVARLRSPWRDDTMLRLAIEDFQRLKLHFYSGDRGLTLVYYEHLQYAWAAYVTTRSAGAAAPQSYVLTATDERRGQRTETRFGGPIEIRWRHGEIVLSRGDIVLLRGPLDEPPTDAFLVGKAVFNGLAIDRDGEFPPAPSLATTETFIERPAELTWRPEFKAENAKLEIADGAVSLVAEKASEKGFVTADLPRLGVREIVLQFDDATPGTGIFLGRADRRPREVLRFVRDRPTGRTGLMFRGDDDADEEHFPTVEDQPAPFVSDKPWVRLVFGAGLLRWSISADGVHWAEPREPAYDLPGDITCLGLSHVRGDPLRKITLKSVRVRRFDGLASLSDEELATNAPPLPLDRGMAAWLAAALAAKPPEASVSTWLRSCAYASLSRGCPNELGRQLLDGMVDDAPAEFDAEQCRAALADAMLLHDWRDYGRLERAWRKLSEIGGVRDGARNELPARFPYSFARPTLMSLPIAAPHALRFGIEPAIRAETIELVQAGQWDKARDLSRALQFFEQRDFAPLLDWLDAAAPQNGRRTSGARRKPEWGSPLIAEVDNDAYSQLAELYATLDGGSFDDAIEATTAFDPLRAGLSPDRRDVKLLVSSLMALRIALDERADVREALARDRASLAALRVRQAIAAGDVAAVRFAAELFSGAPAESEALQWLADRALAEGAFAKAQTIARRGGGSLGELTTPASLAATPFQSDKQLPAPSGFRSRAAARLDGDVGQSPDQEVTRHVRRFNVDWVGRQIACVGHENNLYVSNRFQVAAYDADSGARKWQTSNPPAPMLRSQDWALSRMTPLLVGDRLFARMLHGVGPILYCLGAADGRPLWSYEPPADEFLITDPILLDGWLTACTLARASPTEHMLRLTKIDPATGFVLSQCDVARLRESWLIRRYGALEVDGDVLVVALGGAAIGCDPAGEVRWIRRDEPLPTEEEPSWVRQHFQPPVIREGRVYLMQPGVRAIECVDAETGAVLWSVAAPDVERIVAVAKERLVVQTAGGFEAFDSSTGKRLWRRGVTDLLEGQVVDGESAGLLYSRLDRPPAVRPRVRLAWLDMATGDDRGAATIASLDDDDPRFGPLLAHRGKLWSFFGRGPNDPYRDVVELVRDAAAPFDEASTAPPLVAESWLRHLDAHLVESVRRRLPNWQLLSGDPIDGAGVYDSIWGRNRVLGLRANSSSPLVLARSVSIPAGQRSRLKIALAREPSRPIRVEVVLDGRPVASRDLTAATHPEAWQELDFDLTGAAAYGGLLVRVAPIEGDLPIYFQSIEITL